MTRYRVAVVLAVLPMAACAPTDPSLSASWPAVSYSPSPASPTPSPTPIPTPITTESTAPSAAQPVRTPAESPQPDVANGPDAAPPSKELELRQRYEGRRAMRILSGRATYYHDDLAGNRTASGAIYDPSAFTAAHRTLPFGSVLRVIRVSTGQDVFVRVNDRGPFGNKRMILDLSRAAAEQIGLDRAGVSTVRIEVLELGKASRRP